MTTIRSCDRCSAQATGGKSPLGWDMVPVYGTRAVKRKKMKSFIDMIHLCSECKAAGASLHYDPPSIVEPKSESEVPTPL